VQPADLEAAAKPEDELASKLDMSAWVDETIPASEPPAPTTPGEWVPMVEKPSPGPDLEPIAEPALFAGETPVQHRVLGGTGMLANVPTQDKDAEFLAAAQAALDANQLNEAMQAYTKLIKKNRLLDEVIHDLREAIYRFPVDIIVWQTLGDASMRANRLQDALDAYTKAEELLR
jgi:tetratricopeptide (TPR) repeat protein